MKEGKPKYPGTALTFQLRAKCQHSQKSTGRDFSFVFTGLFFCVENRERERERENRSKDSKLLKNLENVHRTNELIVNHLQQRKIRNGIGFLLILASVF